MTPLPSVPARLSLLAPSRRHEETLLDALTRRPTSFNLYRLMQINEALGGKLLCSGPSSFAFQASALKRLTVDADGTWRAETALHGFLGSDGVLPAYWTERAAAQRRGKKYPKDQKNQEDDSAYEGPVIVDFLDVFYRRTLRLFYEGWKKSRCELAASPSDTAPLSRYLCAWGGTDADALPKGSVTDCFAAAGGVLGRRVHSAAQASLVLSRAVGARVSVVPCATRQVPVPPMQRAKLGREVRLGDGSALGSKIRDLSAQTEIVVSSLSPERMQALLPEGRLYPLMLRLTAALLNGATDVTFRFYPAPGTLPPPRLGRVVRLGLNAALAGTDSFRPPGGAALLRRFA